MRIFDKGKCKFIANFSATMVTSLPSLSVSLSLCLYLSLSPKVPHAQYRKRFRASYNKQLVLARADYVKNRSGEKAREEIKKKCEWGNHF